MDPTPNPELQEALAKTFQEFELLEELEIILEEAADLGIQPDFAENPEAGKRFQEYQAMTDLEFFETQKEALMPYLAAARPISRENFLLFYNEHPGVAHACHIGNSDEDSHFDFLKEKCAQTLKNGSDTERIQLLQVAGMLEEEDLLLAFKQDPINTLIHAHPYLPEKFVKKQFIEHRKKFHTLEIDDTPGLDGFLEFLEHEIGMHPEQIHKPSELPAEPLKTPEELKELVFTKPDLAIKHHHKFGDNGGPSLTQEDLESACEQAPSTAIQYLSRELGGEKVAKLASAYPGAAYQALTSGRRTLDDRQLQTAANHFPEITLMILNGNGSGTPDTQLHTRLKESLQQPGTGKLHPKISKAIHAKSPGKQEPGI